MYNRGVLCRSHGYFNALSVFDQLPPEDMAKEQWKDPVLEIVFQYFTAREKLKTAAGTKVKSKAVQKYFLHVTGRHLKGMYHVIFTSIIM